jgi:hypothetical protein
MGPLTTPHFQDVGSLLLHLTNRKETPLFSRGGPHIRSGLLDPTSFQKPRFRNGLLEFNSFLKNPASRLN